MDLNAMDTDSPMLWLRVDPEMTTLRHVTIEQPDFMWQYMLKYERDIVAQHEVSNTDVTYALSLNVRITMLSLVSCS